MIEHRQPEIRPPRLAMIRLSALAAVVLVQFSLGAIAQEVEMPPMAAGEPPSADSDNQAPIAGTPMVGTAMPANPNDLLTGLYATRALAEICEITIEPAVLAAMEADQTAFAERLNVSAASAEGTYQEIRGAIESTSPDCAPGSADVAGVNDVIAVYTEAAAAAAPTTTTTTPAAPATTPETTTAE
jgi:hypothetical protein